jgi:hypothetical protein
MTNPTTDRWPGQPTTDTFGEALRQHSQFVAELGQQRSEVGRIVCVGELSVEVDACKESAGGNTRGDIVKR